jgi:beta-phosphoglucomutase-like phosphatase (HAD superfamily)
MKSDGAPMAVPNLIAIPHLGRFAHGSGLVPLEATSDGRFVTGRDGVVSIVATGDAKVEFVAFRGHSLAHVTSALGYGAYYPVYPISLEKPAKAVLMDLDGTSVHSERFWIWIIERTIGSLLSDPGFELEPADLPYVSGHSVSEHLQYCIAKYCPGRTLEEARTRYFDHSRREMAAILDGRGRADAFVPAPGLREFLLALKAQRIKIGLVTSGLYEKAYPEIVAAFRAMGMGDPRDFYDAIVTAGFPLHKGQVGTLGELSPKPHPWLYAEVARVGLGISLEERSRVIGIEDSGAGVCAIRLAGFSAIGLAGGNIVESGTRALCSSYCSDLAEALSIIL